METNNNNNNRPPQADVPTELIIHYIVKDYRRMFNEHNKLMDENRDLHAKLEKISSHSFSQLCIIRELYRTLRKLVKMLKKHKIFVPADIDDYVTKNIALWKN